MFSSSEQRVADLLVTGKSNKEIGDLLFVSETTVKFHITNLYRKMNVINRPNFILKYQQQFEGRNNMEQKPLQQVSQPEVKQIAELPNNQGYRNVHINKRTQEDKIQYVNDTFKVADTLMHLHTMMKEVTSKDINPATVNAACNCVSRLNETVNTAIQAARFLNER